MRKKSKITVDKKQEIKQKKTCEPLKVTRKCYTPCVHCLAEVDHKVTNTYPNKNRRVICGACGNPFIMRG